MTQQKNMAGERRGKYSSGMQAANGCNFPFSGESHAQMHTY